MTSFSGVVKMIDSPEDIYHVEKKLAQDLASNALFIARLKNNKGCGMLFMHSAPLILLAKIDKLSLLLNFNLKMFLTQEILFESTEKQAFENNRIQNQEELHILNFIRENEKNGNLEVVRTFVCNSAENERLINPNFEVKGNGEVSANSLFLNRLDYGITGPALLLYEDADVQTTSRNDDVHFLTTYAALVAIESINIIQSADAEWQKITKPTIFKDQQ